ncbi:hypothetical protein OCUBac02_31730 [Bosea sp. ANAM02]|nr:hypothetical protein OCUBac02_31730 [Bosea sp. ANAM02]
MLAEAQRAGIANAISPAQLAILRSLAAVAILIEQAEQTIAMGTNAAPRDYLDLGRRQQRLRDELAATTPGGGVDPLAVWLSKQG